MKSENLQSLCLADDVLKTGMFKFFRKLNDSNPANLVNSAAGQKERLTRRVNFQDEVVDLADVDDSDTVQRHKHLSDRSLSISDNGRRPKSRRFCLPTNVFAALRLGRRKRKKKLKLNLKHSNRKVSKRKRKRKGRTTTNFLKILV